MEGIFRSNNDRIGNTPVIRMTTCQFDSCLITLRSRIAKEGFVRTGIGAQPIGQLSLLRSIIQVANMVQLFHLIGNSRGEGLVVMAQCTSGNSGDKVEVLLAGFIGESAAGSGGEGDGIAAVGFVDAAFEEVGYAR